MCAVACKTAKEGQGLPMQFGVGEATALEGLGRLHHGHIIEVPLRQHTHVSTFI